MKKLVLTAAVMGFAASMASAQVYSQNIVGYSKQEISAGSFMILANQFFGENEASVTIDEAFGASLPEDSELYVWNGSGYNNYAYWDWNGGWSDASSLDPVGDVEIERGDALWVKNAGSSSEIVVFSGNVSLSNSTTNSLAVGFNMVANPYPTAVALDNLNINPQEDDELYVWDGSGYNNYVYWDWNGGWSDASTLDAVGDVEIPVGVGFWYKTLVARTWIMPIPFSGN